MTPAGRPFLQASSLPALAREVRELREAAGLTRPEWAGALGVSLATVRAWERGARRPRGSALRLARIIAEKKTGQV